ncbi:MAG TPA: GNAT family N-acyltransferase [Candidatus Cloacimonadota bacterium]|nr:GNAT family N-acyltransferase [Candidatus Cloacimonadota bacterium]
MYNPFPKKTLKLAGKAKPRNRLRNFYAHIPVYIEKKNYIIKTAETIEELRAALRLRHDVFLQELLKKKKRSGMDLDKFDKRCDHLLIIDKRSNQIIGTYRLQSSLHTKRFYSATEFHMKELKTLPGNKLELGRACVHPDHRNGITISLLWEGIIAYMQASKSSYLFGCSSIKTIDKDEIKAIYYFLKRGGHIEENTLVRPRGKFKVPGLRRHVRKHPLSQLENQSHDGDKIPSLLSSYLKMGAKLHGVPALDKDFKCVDFMTILSAEQLLSTYRRKSRGDS